MVADPMKFCQNYLVAKSVDDALGALAGCEGDSEVIAGGTDLLLDIQQNKHPPVQTLIDITKIPEMVALETRGSDVFIGAAVTHKVLTSSHLIIENCYALGVACGLIGGPQVRNTATIGGNVAHALPAADGTIALMALNAEVEIASTSGRRRVPIADIFLGPGKSTIDKNKELIIGFYVEISKNGEASAFNRIMRPQGVAIAIINMAVWLKRKGNIIKDIRIAVGPSGPIPRRMSKTEQVLGNSALTNDQIQTAYHVLIEEANFRTSQYRASKEYRHKMAGVLLEKTINEAYERSLINSIK
jgi:carbon-monoxide dehydrogenase medium subunit